MNAVARWALVPHYIETINPNWMIPVVGNLVAALVAPRLDAGYDEVRTFLFVSIRIISSSAF